MFSAVERALGDSESLLSRAVQTALKVGRSVPSKVLGGKKTPSAAEVAELVLAEEETPEAAHAKEVRAS